MHDDGYIFIYRKLENSRVFRHPGLLQLWIYCLLHANHCEKTVSVRTGRGMTEARVSPGEFLFGRKTAADALRTTPSTIRNRLLKLEKLGMVNTQPDTHFTRVTVCKWGDYQALIDDVRTGNLTPKGHPNFRCNSKGEGGLADPVVGDEDTTKNKCQETRNKTTSKAKTKAKAHRTKAKAYRTKGKNTKYTSEFDKFWNTYPPRRGRRVGKKVAYRYWKKIPVEEQGSVIEAAGRYAAEIGDYAKDAQRWLRDEIWRDYPSEKEEDVRMTVEELRAAEEAENERIRRMRKQ
jgi:hypothetical protein